MMDHQMAHATNSLLDEKYMFEYIIVYMYVQYFFYILFPKPPFACQLRRSFHIHHPHSHIDAHVHHACRRHKTNQPLMSIGISL